MTWFQARISISEYIFLSVYEMAQKFSARCARRLFLKKNIVKQGKKELAYIVLSVYDQAAGRKSISVYRFLSEYHYLRTPKPNKRIYTAIQDWGVGAFFSIFQNLQYLHSFAPYSKLLHRSNLNICIFFCFFCA